MIRGFESWPDVTKRRDPQRQLKYLEKKAAAHQQFIKISKTPPPVAQPKAMILITSPSLKICNDCEQFKNKVHRFLDLSIEMHESTLR